MNATFSLHMLNFVASLLIHFSSSLTELMESNMSPFMKFANLFYFFWSGGCLVLAATGTSKVCLA